MKAARSASKKKIDKDHAATGRPVSPTEDPTDHSTSAAALAGQVDPRGRSGATANAESMDAVNRDAEAKEDQERAEDDNSLAGKIRKSELFLVNDHSRGGGPYVGISPQNDPKADQSSKNRSAVTPLGMVAPRTGLEIRLKDGTSFTIGDGFGPDATPADWAKVVNPFTKKSLFE